ncbi:hypothetical protein ACWDX8_13400 [Streptomyces anthocyanicus]
MNPSRILRWHYIAAAALVGHCAATSLNANAWWYGTGLFIAGLLLLVALARDIVAADRVCKAALDEATRVDRAARMRAWQDRQHAEIDGCCERWWTSAGAEHDTTHCTRKDQAA